MKKVASWFLVLIWCCMIFNFSNANGEKSGGLSTRILSHIVLLFTDYEEDSEELTQTVEKLSFPIRKCAHFFVYFVLGLLLMNALFISGIKKYTLIIAGGSCILYAISDEFHQTFIEGRSGQVRDVLLDSSASLLASYLYHHFILLKGDYEKNTSK